MKKLHRIIKFKQKVLRQYINMSTDLKKAKNDFEKELFKLINNVVFERNMKNMRKHRDIELVTTKR